MFLYFTFIRREARVVHFYRFLGWPWYSTSSKLGSSGFYSFGLRTRYCATRSGTRMYNVGVRCICFKVLKGTSSNVSIVVVLADPYSCIEDNILHLYRTARGNEENGRLLALDIVIAVNPDSLKFYVCLTAFNGSPPRCGASVYQRSSQSPSHLRCSREVMHNTPE